MTQSDFWLEELPANHSALQAYAKDLKIQEATLLLPMLEFLTDLDPSGAYGKMCQVSSVLGGGRDFGSFLGALGELGYGWAYRVLDAQNFGVAQRRRRVFVVGHLGDWKPAAEVLFESESLRGDIKKGRSEKQDSTTGFVPSIANTLQTTCHDYSRADGFNMIAFENSRRDTLRFFDNVSNTLQAAAGSGGGNVPCVAMQGNLIGRDAGGPQGVGVSESNTMYTLTKTDVHAVAVGSLCARDYKGVGNQYVQEGKCIVEGSMEVRRLTPVECERLQGFPDNYTNIPKAADGNRYKALGNSMAVPVMRWIGERINQYEQRGMEKHLRG